MKKILTTVLAVCLMAFNVPVFAVAVGDVFYDDNLVVYEVTGAASCKVTGYEGTAHHVAIPSPVVAGDAGKFKVTAIGYEAFKDNQVIESVVIPKTVITIDMDAFYGCKMLYKVVFEEGSALEEIKDYAFHYCSGLIDIVIPARKITSHGDSEIMPKVREKAFNSYVPNITYPLTFSDTKYAPKGYANNFGARNMNCPVEGYLVYLKDNEAKTNVLMCSTAAKGAIVIPDRVTSIASPGFADCAQITSLVIPAGITTVGSRIFCGCSSLTSIICKCTTPPVSSYYMETMPEFVGVPKTIPVYVPEASIPAYIAAAGWDQFTNYQVWTQEQEDELSKYTVTLMVNDAKMGTVAGAGTFEGGSDVAIKAIPNAGYKFVRWSDDETDAERILKLTKDTFITAFFAEDLADKYTLTLLVNDEKMGVVTGGGQYEEGQTANIAAVALTGYVFKKWSDNNTEPVRSITIMGDLTLTAYFSEPDPVKYTITVAVNDTAMGSVTGGGVYTENDDVTLTPVPKEGYEFVQWQDGNKDNPRKFKATADATYTAQFQKKAQGIEQVNATLDMNAPMFNVLGQQVDASFHGIVIQNGRKFVK